MILCHCSSITESQYKEYLVNRKDQDKSIIALIEDKLGTNCGTCIDKMIEIINKEHFSVKVSKDS